MTHIDVRVISRKTTEIGKVLSAVVPSALLGKESRRLRGKEETDEQQSSPDHLKRYGDSPSTESTPSASIFNF